ncbi:hypothetical protein jhhlp_007155 [Lomentospora prolificans]|uniref:TUG ubiquitin-like domain-containing protein n=1 Tax=Lomentospora prolificans TaxID=41688 RepID=A0A2N3N1V5_9PEZI|nr:hypothetical protein jhhlp_007155 [Lomentospora prolificans]
MSSHVVVMSSSARSTKVKVTPGTYMSDVLAQACQSLNVSGNFILKHKQRTVDLSVPFRIAGLPSGAKLDLVVQSKSPAPVTVAVAIPSPQGDPFPNGRLGGKYPSNFTVWQILRQVESLPEALNAKLNITARGMASTSSGLPSGSGQLLYEQPTLNIMGRELATFQDFQKTLSQLGYNSGSVLIRLSYKTTGITFFEAQQQIAQYFRELETAKPEDSATPATETDAPALVQPATEGSEQPSTAAKELTPAVSEIANPTQVAPVAEPQRERSAPSDPLQPVNIYAAPTSATPQAALTKVNEADFTPSIVHAQMHQARLKESGKNKRLLSDKELEEQAAAAEAKLAAVQSIEVKVRFPDNTSASWTITKEDTGAKLYKAVRTVMANSSLPFRLSIPGTREVIRDEDSPRNQLMKTYKLTGNIVVNLLWDEGVSPATRGQPFLKTSAAQAAQRIVVPDLAATQDDEEEEKPSAWKQNSSKIISDVGKQGDEAMKKIGKFFKLPGKK